MLRYRLRTLLIALGVVPPVIAGMWFAGTWTCLVLLALVMVAHILGMVHYPPQVVATADLIVALLFAVSGYLIFFR